MGEEDKRTVDVQSVMPRNKLDGALRFQIGQNSSCKGTIDL